MSNRPECYNKTFGVMQKYCDKWGHNFFPYYEILSDDRKASWSKIPLLTKLLKTNLFDYVVWVDDDILLTNIEKNIVDLIEETDNKPISIQKENKTGKKINCGFMIMKNCTKTIEILNYIWETGETSKYKNRHPWEQGEMVIYVYENIDNFHLFDNQKLQSFHNECGSWAGKMRWKENDFSCHFAGIPIKKRILLINELYNQVQKV
jgi:hypothetical protein